VRIDHRLLIAVAFLAGCGSPSAPAQAQEQEVTLSSDAAAEPATVDGCQVIARIDGQVVLACEVLWRVNQMLEANRDRIPPDQYEAVRDQLMQRTLTGTIDQKLLYGEFRRNIPAENLPRIEENLVRPFEEREVPRLLKQLDCKSQRELEQELSRLGSSLADARQSFNEHVIASEWIRSKIKINEEVSPQEMVEYYRDHRAEFEFPTQARWEELSVRKSGRPAEAQQAYVKLAMMGNEVWPRLATNPPADTPVFGDVAKAKSEGFNAAKGGVYDWTTKGSLKAAVVDEAIFSLPLGQMSPILDSGTAFHIVRVLERKEAGCRPFTEVQNDIREKLKDERMSIAQRKYIDDLRKDAKIWTVYTGNVSVETLMGKAPGDTRQR
jgi:hypothetical protein